MLLEATWHARSIALSSTCKTRIASDTRRSPESEAVTVIETPPAGDIR
jgi:hypothetical protein